VENSRGSETRHAASLRAGSSFRHHIFADKGILRLARRGEFAQNDKNADPSTALGMTSVLELRVAHSRGRLCHPSQTQGPSPSGGELTQNDKRTYAVSRIGKTRARGRARLHNPFTTIPNGIWRGAGRRATTVLRPAGLQHSPCRDRKPPGTSARRTGP
jgi:hypothetical protein